MLSASREVAGTVSNNVARKAREFWRSTVPSRSTTVAVAMTRTEIFKVRVLLMVFKVGQSRRRARRGYQPCGGKGKAKRNWSAHVNPVRNEFLARHGRLQVTRFCRPTGCRVGYGEYSNHISHLRAGSLQLQRYNGVIMRTEKNIALEPEVLEQADRIARAENKTVDDLIIPLSW